MVVINYTYSHNDDYTPDEYGRNAYEPIVHYNGNTADLFIADVSNTLYIRPHERVLMHTGLVFDLPEYQDAHVTLRSSSGHNTTVRCTTGYGLIDWNYRGEIMLNLENIGNETAYFTNEKPFVQIEFIRALDGIELNFVTPDKITKTDRGTGGFGSTNKKEVCKIKLVDKFKAKDITKDITKDVAKDVTKDVVKDVAKDVTKDVTKDITKDSVTDADKDAVKDDASKGAGKDDGNKSETKKKIKVKA